jgi:hypothetical protein
MTEYLRVAEFVQVSVMQGRQNAAATAGACHNFSIRWCAMMYQNVPATPAQRMTTLAAGGGGANLVLQKTYVDAFAEGGRDWQSADDLAVAVRGLKRLEYAIPFGNFSQSTVLAVIKAPKNDGMIYTFSFPGGVAGAQGGTHTVAFFRKLQARRGALSPVGTDISAFDPNFGEYVIPALEFNYWFNKFKESYTGKFTTQRLFYVKENK